ncbi:MAG: hypothetical protein AAF408_08095 [Pseudomonadota bacterium]
MTATVGIHILGGGPEIHDVIRASAMPDVVRAVGSVIWHAITWILIVLAIAIAWLSRNSNPALEATVIVIQLGFAALFLFYGVTQLGNVWEMPQWVIFLGIPVLMLAARRRAQRSQAG